MKKILSKLIITGVIIGFACHAVLAGSSQKVFTDQVVLGVDQAAGEIATSTGYYIGGATSIGFAWDITEGTSSPNVSASYQLSMDNTNWSTSTVVIDPPERVNGGYVASDTAITFPPTEWIRWHLRTELLNATNTTMSLWFITKDEGGE